MYSPQKRPASAAILPRIVLAGALLAPGAASADADDGRFTYEVEAVKASQVIFRERMNWFADSEARRSGICHPGRAAREPADGWMVWHKCDDPTRSALIEASASTQDLQAEVEEWVVEPCMEVAAALDVESASQELIELGIKREHVVELLVASRSAATADIVAGLDPNVPWERRRLVYPALLKLCLLSLEGMQTGVVDEGKYLPDPCAESESSVPEWLYCPRPYVEMIPDGTYTEFAQAWHCVENDYSLGLIQGGGCGGSGGMAMFMGWRLPDGVSKQ